MFRRTQSLKQYCRVCRACCCRHNRLNGSPILSFEEAAEIISCYPESIEAINEIVSPVGQYYYVLRQGKNRGQCYFLDKNNNCKIHHIKPLDCQSYPVKAVYAYSSIKFITDKNCLAAGRLHYKFLRQARQLARDSISRFHKETYLHWLENHIGWARNR